MSSLIGYLETDRSAPPTLLSFRGDGEPASGLEPLPSAAGAPDSDPAEPDGVDVLFADVLPVEVSFGLLPLMSATCFAPWFNDANSRPFFRCVFLCSPLFLFFLFLSV